MKRWAVAVCILSLSLVGCSAEKEPTAWYGWFENTAVVFTFSADGESLSVISVPGEVVTGYGTALGVSTIQEALVSLVGVPSAGFFTGSAQAFSQIRSILDDMAIERGYMGNAAVPQRVQVLVGHAGALRKTPLADTLGRLAGIADIDGMLQKLEKVQAFSGFDAKDLITLDDRTQWELLGRWFTSWTRQGLASVQRSNGR